MNSRSESAIQHPLITRCSHSRQGIPAFAEGAPYLRQDNIRAFLAALRDDVSLIDIQRAPPVFRSSDERGSYPQPETCAPYVDANSLGYLLRLVLPLVFVRTRSGELLLESRVALQYLWENRSRFPDATAAIQEAARHIFRDDAYSALRDLHPEVADAVAQPYNAFSANHLSIRTGLWVRTPLGISTIIGPPLNRRGILTTLSGAVETDWHHLELFIVAEFPCFNGQVLIVEPGSIVGQLYFVARTAAEVTLSISDPASEPTYRERWDAVCQEMERAGRIRLAERSGVGSIDIGCPHCCLSVTAAAEGGVSEHHVLRYAFHPGYKYLRHSLNARDDLR
jgi:hypothetical protein